jgi:hypothetical protein
MVMRGEGTILSSPKEPWTHTPEPAANALRLARLRSGRFGRDRAAVESGLWCRVSELGGIEEISDTHLTQDDGQKTTGHCEKEQ